MYRERAATDLLLMFVSSSRFTIILRHDNRYGGDAYADPVRFPWKSLIADDNDAYHYRGR